MAVAPANILTYNATLNSGSKTAPAQAASYIQKNAPAPSGANPYNQGGGGQVLGTNIGSSNGGGGSAPAPTGGGAPQIPQPSAPNVDFNSLIQPALDALDAAIPGLNQTEADQETGINQNKQTSLDTANQGIASQTGIINQAQTQQTQNEQSASDAARRQYAEIQQGLQARYGATTGTGAFASDLSGSQTLRSLSDIKTAAANAQTQLSQKLQEVQATGQTLLKQINDQAGQQISQAKDNLNAQLSDIRNQKGQLLAHKADLAANAMQQYQATVNQVNAANAQFAQQLYVQQQSAQQSLQAGLSKAGAIASAATPQDLISLVKQFQQAGLTPTVSQKLAGGGSLSLTTPSTANQSNDPAALLQQLGLQ